MLAFDGEAWIEVRTDGGRFTVKVMALLWTPWAEAHDLRSAHRHAARESGGVHSRDALVGTHPNESEAAHLISALVVAHSGELLCPAGKDRRSSGSDNDAGQYGRRRQHSQRRGPATDAGSRSGDVDGSRHNSCRPLPLRVATEPLPSEAQVNVIPLIKLLNWSYPAAVYAWVWPAEIEAVDGDTLIWVNTGWGAGGSATVMITDVLFTPALTSIVPVPAERPLTRPVGLTLAAPLELEKVKVIPGMTLPS